MKHKLISFLVYLFASPVLHAQTNGAEDIHLFQSFFKDASITVNPYGEGGFRFDNFNYFSDYTLGVQGGYDVSEGLEAGAAVAFISIDPDLGRGESGVTDILLTARHKVRLASQTRIAAGGYLTPSRRC